MRDQTQGALNQDFVNKYDLQTYLIRAKNSCYAISADWWYTFKLILDETRFSSDMVMGYPDEEYKQKILEKYNEKSLTEEMLKDLTNWDRMKLKSDMKYGEQFVIISQQIWNFLLYHFGGGPEIELMPEKYERSAEKPASSKIITIEQDNWISSDICINMDVKRIYYMKSNNDQDVTACFVSLTAKAKLFFEILCRKLFSPLYKAEISLLNEENQFVRIKDYNSKTLEELGIQENSIVRIDFNRDGVPQTSDPIMDSNTTSRQFPENIPYEEFMDDPVGRTADSDDPIPLPNSTTDYSKPPENNLVIAEKKWEIDYDKVTKVNKEVEALTKSNKKFTLEYRSLNSIKTNLKALESDWSAYLKSNLAMCNHHKDGKLS